MKRAPARAWVLLAVSALVIMMLPAACAPPTGYQTIDMGTPYGKDPYITPHLQIDEMNKRYRFGISTDPSQPAAGQVSRVTVSISPADGQPLLPPDESMIHFVVASENLEDIQFMEEISHQPLIGDGGEGGSFTFPVTFSRGGSYSVTAIFLDRGVEVNKVQGIEVAGPEQTRTSWNFDRRKSVGGIDADIIFQPPMRPNFGRREFIIELSAGGQPVMGLEPYLGAFGHMTVFRQSGREGLHIHGNTWRISQDPAPGRMAVTGPKLYFPYSLSGGYKYRLVVRFRRGGKQYTIPFDLKLRSVRTSGGDNDRD